MSIEDVTNEIISDAEEKAREIREEADQKAESIKQKAQRKADEIIEEKEQEAKEKAEKKREKEISNARMEARKIKMNEKSSQIQKTFDRAKEEMADILSENPEEFFSSCKSKCSFEPDVVVGPKEYSDIDGINHEQKDIDGIVLKNRDGSMSQDFTAEAILDEMKNTEKKTVAEVLFE